MIVDLDAIVYDTITGEVVESVAEADSLTGMAKQFINGEVVQYPNRVKIVLLDASN